MAVRPDGQAAFRKPHPSGCRRTVVRTGKQKGVAMHTQDRERFASTIVELKDGRMVTVRLLAVEDGAAMGDFYELLPRDTYRFYCPHPLTRENATQKAASALSPTLVALVAENEAQEIVGYASYRWQNQDSRASTFGICLRTAYRGIGLGQAMIERLLGIAENIGPPIMSLEVQEANPRALNLYRKMGFKVVRKQMRKQIEEFPPEPEYYMERPTR
jgi:ribosomal protein S18 acetylase RimI-like enzyme